MPCVTNPTTLAKTAQRLRRTLLKLVFHHKGGHIGGMFSAAEIMTVLYYSWLRLDPERPQDPDRDRFILSKGHCALLLYCILVERGFMPANALEDIFTSGSHLACHPEFDPAHGLEATTGSLGHGLAVATGLAWAAKQQQRPSRIVVLLGDGECQEGSVWEAAQFAAMHQLDNLIAIVDFNKLQAIQPIAEVTTLNPAEQWRSFGWHVIEVDGHDCHALQNALSGFPRQPHKPELLLAHTVKGKGVSYMENQPLWHYRAPTQKEYEQAIRELTN